MEERACLFFLLKKVEIGEFCFGCMTCDWSILLDKKSNPKLISSSISSLGCLVKAYERKRRSKNVLVMWEWRNKIGMDITFSSISHTS